MALEKEIPSFLMNLSSVIQALEDASLSINPKGQLKLWIKRLGHDQGDCPGAWGERSSWLFPRPAAAASFAR
jgi:hypothetical protein